MKQTNINTFWNNQIWFLVRLPELICPNLWFLTSRHPHNGASCQRFKTLGLHIHWAVGRQMGKSDPIWDESFFLGWVQLPCQLSPPCCCLLASSLSSSVFLGHDFWRTGPGLKRTDLVIKAPQRTFTYLKPVLSFCMHYLLAPITPFLCHMERNDP